MSKSTYGGRSSARAMSAVLFLGGVPLGQTMPAPQLVEAQEKAVNSAASVCSKMEISMKKEACKLIARAWALELSWLQTYFSIPSLPP